MVHVAQRFEYSFRYDCHLYGLPNLKVLPQRAYRLDVEKMFVDIDKFVEKHVAR